MSINVKVLKVPLDCVVKEEGEFIPGKTVNPGEEELLPYSQTE